MILTLKNNKRIDSTRQSLDLSLASAVMGGTDPRFVPILQPLIFLQSPLQLQPPRPSPRHSLLPTTINTSFVVGSLSPVNHELPDPPELFRKGGMDIKMWIFKNFPIGNINISQCLIYISLFGYSCLDSVFLFRISGFCSQTLEIYWFRSTKATQAFAL